MKKLFITLLILLFPAFVWAGGVCMMGGGIDSGGSSPDPEDQFSGNPIFSVGVTATELDNEGTITVASNIATFSIAFPTNVGVGDVVQYDVNNGGTIEDGEYGIIHGINSDRTKAYLLHTDGTNVTNTSATTSVYDIFRAYTSLNNWETRSENTNIASVLHDSTNSGTDYELHDTDLTTSAGAGTEDGPLYVACYGDGADTTAVDIDGWTTDADDWIEIFTPVDIEMVGVTQRHSGIWNDAKYRREVTDATGILCRENYVRIDGLQVKVIETGTNTARGMVFGYGQDAGNNETRVSNCIIRGNCSGAGAVFGIATADSDIKLVIYNTVIYDIISGTNSHCKAMSCSDCLTVDVYNTTINNSWVGVYSNPVGIKTFKNVVIFETTNDIDGTVTLQNCATDDGDDSGNNGNITITQSADDYAAMVVNADGGNYAITDSASQLNDAGIDDPGGAIQDDTDIAGTERVSLWDIGAFEL